MIDGEAHVETKLVDVTMFPLAELLDSPDTVLGQAIRHVVSEAQQTALAFAGFTSSLPTSDDAEART